MIHLIGKSFNNIIVEFGIVMKLVRLIRMRLNENCGQSA